MTEREKKDRRKGEIEERGENFEREERGRGKREDSREI